MLLNDGSLDGARMAVLGPKWLSIAVGSNMRGGTPREALLARARAAHRDRSGGLGPDDRDRRRGHGGAARRGLRAGGRAEPRGTGEDAERRPRSGRSTAWRSRAWAGAPRRSGPFERALTIDPNYLAALEGAGQAHYEAGSRRAVPLLERILRQRPDDPTAHAMLAVLDYREGDCQNAVAHFAKAGAVIETQLDALQAQSTCLVRLRQLDAAIDVLRRTVTLEPANPRRRKLLAAVQLMADKPQDSLATLGAAARGRRRRRRDARSRLRGVPEGRRHAASGLDAPAAPSCSSPGTSTCISTSRTSRSRISPSRWASRC